ncbi:hypothetical protein [Fibrella arboris]|uniref:hypothetical protein n=1 Tax=Fibrella arboris TaxID=3242486 RepID=UPI0035211DA8
MADPARRLIQLQSFVTIEYGQGTVKFILLDNEGRPINAQSSPLVFAFGQVFDKQVFTTKINNQPVLFVNVLLDANQEQYRTLKDLTHTTANLETLEFRALATSKDPLRPPRKDLEANTVREWTIENGVLATVSRVAESIDSHPA